MLFRYFKLCGLKTEVHIPDRILEGYGPNIEAFRKLKAKGATLIVTVDCGSASEEVVRLATREGMEIVVIDHHITECGPADAVAVVNPNRVDDHSGLGNLTAAGVCFLMCVAFNRALRESGYFKNRNIAEPNLLILSDLAALGTVCDVAPLRGVNRLLVSHGLRTADQGGNPGITALARVGRVTGRFDAYHLGFVLGPRINAGGRVGRADAGFQLLTREDFETAYPIAEELERENQIRKELEDKTLEAAYLQIEKENYDLDPVIVAHGDGWHPGVIGIVAARIKEKYGKPAFALGGDEAGDYKGSGRSVSGVDIGSAVCEAVKSGILVGGGGHKAAAGLTITEKKIADFRRFLAEKLGADVNAALENARSVLDTDLTVAGANAEFLTEIERLAPFGVGNPSPVFCLRNTRVTFAKQAGEAHLRLTLADGGGKTLKAVAFRCLETPLGAALMQKGTSLNIFGTLKRDTWQGRDGVQFVVEDAAYA